MKLQTYAIYDSKARVFSQPFFAPNNEVALRMLQTTVSDSSTNLSKFPADYSLFRIAEYDDEIGTLVQCNHESLGLASQFTKE